jgi:hypothetical protein
MRPRTQAAALFRLRHKKNAVARPPGHTTAAPREKQEAELKNAKKPHAGDHNEAFYGCLQAAATTLGSRTQNMPGLLGAICGTKSKGAHRWWRRWGKL